MMTTLSRVSGQLVIDRGLCQDEALIRAIPQAGEQRGHQVFPHALGIRVAGVPSAGDVECGDLSTVDDRARSPQ